jgi:acetyl esterase/lipase
MLFTSLRSHCAEITNDIFPDSGLAPQYPFPCALHDAFASYLFLIDPPAGSDHAAIHPSKIILSGDSAGGGLALSVSLAHVCHIEIEL